MKVKRMGRIEVITYGDSRKVELAVYHSMSASVQVTLYASDIDDLDRAVKAIKKHSRRIGNQ